MPYPIRYCTRRTHGEATVTAAEVEREENEEESVVLPFVSTRQYIILKATSSSRTVVTNSRYTIMSSVYQVITTNMTPSYKNNQQHHPIVRSCLDSLGNGWARTRQQIHKVGWHNETSLTNIPIHYYRFIVHTNTIINTNEQQQKNKKERGKECY